VVGATLSEGILVMIDLPLIVLLHLSCRSSVTDSARC